jgi:plastocyanin
MSETGAKRAKAKPGKSAKAAVDHEVELSVNESGEFTYDPSFVRVKRGDTVTFGNPNGHSFAVMFKDQSPGNKLSLSDRDPTITIDSDAPYAVYHYAAAVFDGNKGRVHLDSGCGDIGVEN